MPGLSFDYVVVGGGSAGCAAAAGLAADGRFSVALLESGRTDRNPWIHVPATFFRALKSQDAAAVVSEPDPTLAGERFAVPQGRVLGGGSSVNGMIYMRGQARDYDDWAALGCTGWSYADVLPVFMAQEANTRLGAPFHGRSGPVTVADPALKHPVTAAVIAAAEAAGLPPSADFNGAVQEGTGWYQVTAHRGRRQSAAVAFLRPALATGRLTLLTGHAVRRIAVQGRRAVAVEARDAAGAPVVLTARREILLCAGAFQSPKLLMLSGIGPAEHLARHGIDLVHDAPEVGANWQDHVGTPVTRVLRAPIGLHGADRGLKALGHGLRYALTRGGLLASNLLEGGACADTDGDGRPDVQFNFAPFAPGRPGQPPLPVHAVQVHPMTMRPASRGRVDLASADPETPLRFRANVLDAPADMDTLRRGVRLARAIFAAPPLRDLVAEEIWPGPDIASSVGANALDEAIRRHARTIFHPAGTCRMGPDPGAVVDPCLRVNGVEGLRIADCSIMPALVSGNTNAPAMMIGGRAAALLCADA